MAPGLMHDGLEAAAARYPDHPGVLAGSDAWTFRELDDAARVQADASALRRGRPG